jgi:hypothetical protein
MSLYLLQFQCEQLAVFGSGGSYLYKLGPLDEITVSERRITTVDTVKWTATVL